MPRDLAPRTVYRLGLAVLRDANEAPEWMHWDARIDAWVAPGHRYPEVRRWAEARGGGEQEGGAPAGETPVETAEAEAAGSLPLFDLHTPRDYQREALARWRAGGRRGTVVLPTGSGKTLVALLAAAEGMAEGRGACVVAPTRALVGQWFGHLADAFGAGRVGAFYGDEKEVRSLTVTTYHSAFALLERHGARFDLLVLDEAHHLADTAAGEAAAFLDALRIAPCERRLGLTATYPDGARPGARFAGGSGGLPPGGGRDGRRRARGLRPGAPLRGADPHRARALRRPERHLRGLHHRPRLSGALPRRQRLVEGVHGGERRSAPVARRAFRAFLERERLVALAERKLRRGRAAAPACSRPSGPSCSAARPTRPSGCRGASPCP